MVKKVRLSELPDDIESGDVWEKKKAEIDRVSIDSLPDGPIYKEVSKTVPKINEAQTEKRVQKSQATENIKIVNKDWRDFPRNIIYSFLTKLWGHCLILIILDVIAHLSKIFQYEKRLFEIEYQSLYFSENSSVGMLKVLFFVLITYFLTKKDSLKVSRSGIICDFYEVQNSLFLTSVKVYLSWERIKKAQKKYRFFEPYIYFYDDNNDYIGQVLLFTKGRDFCKYIGEYAGEKHPIFLAMNE